jgi:hypothetical protein
MEDHGPGHAEPVFGVPALGHVRAEVRRIHALLAIVRVDEASPNLVAPRDRGDDRRERDDRRGQDVGAQERVHERRLATLELTEHDHVEAVLNELLVEAPGVLGRGDALPGVGEIRESGKRLAEAIPLRREGPLAHERSSYLVR